MQRKKKILVVIAAALIIVIVGFSTLVPKMSKKNNSSQNNTQQESRVVKVKIEKDGFDEDDYEGLKPGDTIKLVPVVELEDGSQEAYIRILDPVVTITQKNGQVSSERLSSVNGKVTSNWIYDSSYYYYKKKLTKENDKAVFLDSDKDGISLTLPGEWGDSYKDVSISLTISLEAAIAERNELKINSNGIWQEDVAPMVVMNEKIEIGK